MSILYKYKKDGEKGFKSLVYNLEKTIPRRRARNLDNIFMEDPVYASYLPDNFIGLNNLFDRGGENLKEIFDHMPSAITTFYMAFYSSIQEEQFLEIFPNEWKKCDYENLQDRFTNIPIGLRNQAFHDLFVQYRLLQEQFILPQTDWKIPPMKVLKGLHFKIPIRGPFILKYEDCDQIALKGEYEDKLRKGKWEHYYSNGQLLAEGIYHLGEKEDQWIIYNEDGMIKAQGKYGEGMKNGEWLYVDEDGLDYCEYYEKGRQVDSHDFEASRKSEIVVDNKEDEAA